MEQQERRDDVSNYDVSNCILVTSSEDPTVYVSSASASSATSVPLAQENQQLPATLEQFKNSFSGSVVGEQTWGIGGGFSTGKLGPVDITLEDITVSVVDTADYASANNQDLRMIVVQGYGQITVLNRFYISCIMIGKENPVNLVDAIGLLDHLTRTDEERKKLEEKKIDEVQHSPSFYKSLANDPINDSKSTYGLYIVTDKARDVTSWYTYLQGYGIVDLVNCTYYKLALAASASVNTFTNSFSITIGGSMQVMKGTRYTGTVGIRIDNGMFNGISIAVAGEYYICTDCYATGLGISVGGWYTSQLEFGGFASIGFGPKMSVPDGLGIAKKLLFPNLKGDFYPLSLEAHISINPWRNFYNLGGSGTLFANFSLSVDATYDNGDFSIAGRVGTVRNKYLNATLGAEIYKREYSWGINADFHGSVTVPIWKDRIEVSAGGGIDVKYNSHSSYSITDDKWTRYRDLTISVYAQAKIGIRLSYQNSWVINFPSVTIDPPPGWVKPKIDYKPLNPLVGFGNFIKLPTLMLPCIISQSNSSSLSASDETAESELSFINGELGALLDDGAYIMQCSSQQLTAEEIASFSASSESVIASTTWEIDEHCADSGVVKFKVGAEYTLVDSEWRLTHTVGDQVVSVYTAENADGIVSKQEFSHDSYDLLVEMPEAGFWTLDILGDSNDSGEIVTEAMQDEMIFTDLEILDQTETTITFRYSAFTCTEDDYVFVRLYAEEITNEEGKVPYNGAIAYLEESENGEFIWEILDEEGFNNNNQYRFYLSVASSASSTIAESNCVETTLDRYDAELDCSWELYYSAENANTVTAYITITNAGLESTACEWELLDLTNQAPADENDDNESAMAESLASGTCLEVKGNSSVTLRHTFTITDELRDNPSNLLLTVARITPDGTRLTTIDENSGEEVEQLDDADEIIFVPKDSMYGQAVTVTWQAVEGAASYVLHYALEGDWEEGGVFINDLHDTSYTLNVAPGEYEYRVIALDENGNAIGTWNEEQAFDVMFTDTHTIEVDMEYGASMSAVFTMNDGIYSFNAVNSENFSGTLDLYDIDLVKIGEDEDDGSVDVQQREIKTATLEFVNGILQAPVSEILLDHGDYYWVWTRSETDASLDSEITVQITGEVFSMEMEDRETYIIGSDDSDMELEDGVYVETLEGEVGYCNEDSIYRYITDEGGELSLSIKEGTVFDANLRIHVYLQNMTDAEFELAETLSVMAGEYSADTVILDHFVVKTNFYLEIESWDEGQGGHNTEYAFDLSFDAFGDSVQTEDILEVDGDALSDWIGYRNEYEHRYLLQIDADDRYAIRLQGDAHDAVLRVCEVTGSIIEEMQIGADGTAYIDGIELESGNYFVVVDSTDNGEGKHNTDYILSASKISTLYPKIDNQDDTWEKVSQLDSAAFDQNIENWLGVGDEADFFKFALDPETVQQSALTLTFDEKTAQAVRDGILKISCLDEWGHDLVVKELASGEWDVDISLANTEVYVGILRNEPVKDFDYSFKAGLAASV